MCSAHFMIFWLVSHKAYYVNMGREGTRLVGESSLVLRLVDAVCKRSYGRSACFPVGGDDEVWSPLVFSP